MDVYKNFTKFTGKDLCRSLFLNKVPGLERFAKYLTAFSLSKFPFKIFNLGKASIALVIWTKLYTKYALFQ